MIEITHTREDGTRAEGTHKGDEAGRILNRAGFRWSRDLECWKVPHSERRASDRHQINQAAAALRTADYEVSVEVDDVTRPTTTYAQHQAQARDRAADRAQRYGDRAQRAANSAQALSEEVREWRENFPLGQPVLVGHHSQARDERDRARARRKDEKAVQESHRGRYWNNRARAADRATRPDPVPTVLRRIERNEAHERKLLWRLKNSDDDADRERLRADLDEVRERLDVDRAAVAEAEADGEKVWSAHDFVKGDFVRGDYGHEWREVLRVNKKSVTVSEAWTEAGDRIITREIARHRRLGGYTQTLPYDKVTGRLSAEQGARLAAQIEQNQQDQQEQQ